MYMIEISEDKVDKLAEHVSTSIKCLTKVAECLEELRGGEDDYEEEEFPRYASSSRSMYPRGGRNRYARGGRYSNY